MEPNYDEPVAYDREGNALYRHPPVKQAEPAAEPTPAQPAELPTPAQAAPPVAAAPDVTPQVAPPPVPGDGPTTAEKHADSVSRYPELNLSEDEYVISAVQRDPFGIMQIWFGGASLIIVFFLITMSSSVSASSRIFLYMALGIMSVIVFFGVILLTRIYNGNKFFVTNESVILTTQHSLYSKNEQTANLDNIEDVSYHQPGFFATTFNYGTIRLTIEGDVTDYNFSYVSSPKRQTDLIHNEIERYKKSHAG